MRLPLIVAVFVRHAAYASGLLFLGAVTAERLAPGSVLSYTSLWRLLVIVGCVQGMALLGDPPVKPRLIREGQHVFLFGLGLLALLFLAILVREEGTAGLILVFAATLVLVMSIVWMRTGKEE